MSRIRLFAVVLSSLASLINLFRRHHLVKTARQTLAVGLVVMLVTNHTVAASGIVETA